MSQIKIPRKIKGIDSILLFNLGKNELRITQRASGSRKNSNERQKLGNGRFLVGESGQMIDK